MKSIKVLFITFTLLLVSNIEAQTGPTKQQTVTELNNLKIGGGVKYLEYFSRYGEARWKNFSTHKFSVDEDNDCLLIFDWTESYIDQNNSANNYSDKTQRKIMDMSKVKTIYFTLTADAIGSQLNEERGYSDEYSYNLNIHFIIG